MKVAIYTSNTPGAYNDYNIRRLTDHFPGFEYLFVEVVRPDHSTLKDRLRARYYAFREPKGSFNRDRKQLAKNIYGKFRPVDPARYERRTVKAVNDDESVSILKSFAPDIILQAGAGILKEQIFDIARIGTINVHHGYAPEIRGIQSTFWCLYYGLHDFIGVTCHFIDKNLDTGAVILQYKYPYREGDTYLCIQERLCEEGAGLLVRSVEKLSALQVPRAFDEQEVDSYYFSSVKPDMYMALKAHHFRPVSGPEGLKTKKKLKSVLKA